MPGPATSQTVTMWAGDTVTIYIPVLDDDGNEVDLGGATAVWWMGKSAKAVPPDVYITKRSDQTMTGDDGVTRPQIEIAHETDRWALSIHLNRADTETGVGSNPPPKTYYHEAGIIDASGNKATVTTGPFVLNPAIGGNQANG